MCFAEAFALIVFLLIGKPADGFVPYCCKAFCSSFVPVQVRTLPAPVLSILGFLVIKMILLNK